MLSSIPPDVDLAGCQWFIQMKFLACMPKHMHSLLLSTDFPSAEAMANFADNIVGVGSPSPGSSSRLEAVYQESCPEDAVLATSQQKQPPSDLCYYHRRFGPQAERCNGRGCRLSKPSLTRLGNDQRGSRN